MTVWEYVRMACYVVSAPTLLYLALWMARHRMYVESVLYAAMSLLFLWYMIEITIASTGVNTRSYRVIGTPMIIVISFAAVMLAARVRAGKV